MVGCSGAFPRMPARNPGRHSSIPSILHESLGDKNADSLHAVVPNGHDAAGQETTDKLQLSLQIRVC